MGSIPIGRAKDFKDLAENSPALSNICPIYVGAFPWTILDARGLPLVESPAPNEAAEETLGDRSALRPRRSRARTRRCRPGDKVGTDRPSPR